MLTDDLVDNSVDKSGVPLTGELTGGTRRFHHLGLQQRNNLTELQLRLQLLSCKRIKTTERMELQSSAAIGVHRNNFYNN